MSNRALEKLGVINNIDIGTITYRKSTDSPEISFTVFKDMQSHSSWKDAEDKLQFSENEDNNTFDFEDKNTALFWEEINDLAVIYVQDYDEYFEISVETTETETTTKHVTGTYLPVAELSNIRLHDVEINTESDIEREDYTKATVFYAPADTQNSLLHRVLEKTPNYKIGEVDGTLWDIQRTFSFSNISIKDALNEIEAQFGCKFIYDSKNRIINVVDMYTTCNHCGHRGEFYEECPQCGSTDLTLGYGKYTNVFISNNNLSETVTLKTRDNEMKNCFYLKSGDDDMDATIINLNPNGTRYIYHWNDRMLSNASDNLKNSISEYDLAKEEQETKTYMVGDYSSYDALVDKYNSDKYATYDMSLEEEDRVLKNNNFSHAENREGYKELIRFVYDAIDFQAYLDSSLAPAVKFDIEKAKAQSETIKEYVNGVTLGIVDLKSSTSDDTVKSALTTYVKMIIDGAFKVDINLEKTGEVSSPYSRTYNTNIVVKSYRDEDDTSSCDITFTVNGDYSTYIRQDVEKRMKEIADVSSIYKIIDFHGTDSELQEYVSYYSSSRLESFSNAYEEALSIIAGMNQDDADSISHFKQECEHKKVIIDTELELRKAEVQIVEGVVDKAQEEVSETTSSLDMTNFLKTPELIAEFFSYRREDEYSNANFISTGLDNEKMIERANEFLKLANDELDKASREIYELNGDVHNLFMIKEFEPLWDSFDVFNWIKYRVDDMVFNLRIISYEINFSDTGIGNINVSFSSASEGLTALPMGTVSEVLKSAKSVSTAFPSLKLQTFMNKNKILETVNNNDVINAMLLASRTDIRTNADMTRSVLQRHSSLQQDYDGFKLYVESNYTTNSDTEKIVKRVTQAELKLNDYEGFKVEVASTYATKDSVNSLEERVQNAELEITDERIVAKVTSSQKYKDDLSPVSIVSSINQTAEEIKISASKINLEGAVTISSLDDDVASKVNAVTGLSADVDNLTDRVDTAEGNINNVDSELKGLYYPTTTLIDGGKIYTGSIIAGSIAASAINVADLRAFAATIGGFDIGEFSISAGKESYNDNNNGIYFGTRDDSRNLTDESENKLVDEQGNILFSMEGSAEVFGIGRADGYHLFYDGETLDIVGNIKIKKLGDNKSYAIVENDGLYINTEGKLRAKYGEEAAFYAYNNHGERYKAVTMSKYGIQSDGTGYSYTVPYNENDPSTYYEKVSSITEPIIFKNLNATDNLFIDGKGIIKLRSHGTSGFRSGRTDYIESATGGAFDFQTYMSKSSFNVVSDLSALYQTNLITFHKETVIDENGIVSREKNIYDANSSDRSVENSKISLSNGEIVISYGRGEEGDYTYDNVLKIDSFGIKKEETYSGIDGSTFELSDTRLRFKAGTQRGDNYREFDVHMEPEVAYELLFKRYDSQCFTVSLQDNGNTGVEIYGESSYIDFHYGNDSTTDYNQRLISSRSGNLLAYPGISNSSDKRLKHDIKDLDDSIVDTLLNVKPKSFVYDRIPDRTRLGFVAQDVIKNMEDNGFSKDEMSIIDTFIDDNGVEMYAVDYTQFIAPLVYGYQKLNKEHQSLLERVKELENNS